MLHLAVGPLGRLATLDNAFEGASRFGLSSPDAARIIVDVGLKVMERHLN